MGQLPNFLGYDRKPLTSLPSARSLDPRVQCQKVCLESDFVYHTGNSGNFLRRPVYRPDGCNSVSNDRLSLSGLVGTAENPWVKITLGKGGALFGGR